MKQCQDTFFVPLKHGVHSNPGTQVEPAQNKDFGAVSEIDKTRVQVYLWYWLNVYSNSFFKTSVFMFVDGVCDVAIFKLFCVFSFFCLILGFLTTTF